MMAVKHKNPKRIKKGRDKQPIRDKQLIDQILREVFEINKRDWFLLKLGLNTGRRIGDLLPLKVSDLKGKDHLFIHEQKTDKTIKIKITKIRKDIRLYIAGMGNDDYLFGSRQKNKYGLTKHITYKRAYQIIKDIFEKHGLNNTATHTLRKTFGYWYYKLTGDIEGLRIIFNHGNTSTTLLYIGVTQEEIDDRSDKVKF